MIFVSFGGKVYHNYCVDKSVRPSMVRLRYPEHIIRKHIIPKQFKYMWLVGLSGERWTYDEKLATDYGSPIIAVNALLMTGLPNLYAEFIEVGYSSKKKRKFELRANYTDTTDILAVKEKPGPKPKRAPKPIGGNRAMIHAKAQRRYIERKKTQQQSGIKT